MSLQSAALADQPNQLSGLPAGHMVVTQGPTQGLLANCHYAHRMCQLMTKNICWMSNKGVTTHTSIKYCIKP